MEKQILLDAIKSNLHTAGNAGLVEVAMAAIGQADLGRQVAVDMIRLAEARKAADADGNTVSAWMSGDHVMTALDTEVERRTNEFWQTVAAVNLVLGFTVE